jgi:hypothetical protein
MSDSQAYEYRAFLLQIADKLSQEDSKKIAFLEELPSDMGSKPPLTLLMQLEMRSRVSASRPDDLAKILKKIERLDLAKKVKDFVKQQKKGRPTVQSDLNQRCDHATMKLNASLHVTLLQCEILLQQVANLREEAEKLDGYKRVEEVVAEAQTIAEKFQRKLQYASKFVQEEQGFCREQNGDSNPCSPDSQLSSLEFEAESQASAPTPISSQSQPAGCVRLTHAVNSSELRAAAGNLKAQSASLPRPSRGSPTTQAQPTTTASTSTTKQPLLPPSNQRHPHPLVDNNTPAPTRHGSLSRSRAGSPGPLPVPSGATTTAAGDTGRHLVQGLEEQPRSGVIVAQLVTGRLKPTPPPKPKIKGDQKIKQAVKDEVKADSVPQKVDAQSSKPKDDPDYDYVHTSSYTGTGDSGFGDSREFLRVPMPGEYQLPSQGALVHPPHAAHHAAAGQQQQLQGGILDASYSAVNGSAEPGYYKSLQRDTIQGKKIMALIFKPNMVGIGQMEVACIMCIIYRSITFH